MSEGWWALLGVIVGAVAAGVFNLLLQKRQFSHEKEMHILQNQGTENVKALLKERLSHKNFTDRSFGVLKKSVGGYSENEIKQLLHEVGAKTATDENGKEWWYLAEREEERNKKRKDRA